MATDDPHAARRLDTVAVRAALRRLARAPEPPWLHAEVARRMAQRLEIVRARPRRILDWWCGLGASASELRRVHPQAVVVAVEPDALWAARTRAARTRPWWRVAESRAAASQVCEEADEIAPGAGLVWANMMLHAVVDPPALFARWESLLAPEGFVMFSCLGPGSLRELRSLYDELGWGSATPGFVDMHDLGDMLLRAGFADPVMDQEVLTLSWPDADALLAELRGLGGNAAPDRHPGLRTRRWRQGLGAALRAMAGADGRISLSFEVAYGHAFKAAPRLRADEPTWVSLDSMRSLLRSRRGRNMQRPLG